MWKGRFQQDTAPLLQQYSESISFDWRLWPHDIEGSIAHSAALEAAGELRRIAAPVATELEITEWADREMKSPGGGQALLFEKPTVNGVISPFPLAVNTLGSRRRMAHSTVVPGSSAASCANSSTFVTAEAPPPTTSVRLFA